MAESNNNFVVKPFAGNATNNGQFGSFDAGTPQTTNDVIFMQGLDAWLSGWLNATSGATKLPRLEEFQGIQRVFSQALININQYGIKPYLAEETYRLHAFVQDENGKLYQSLEDNNVSNPLTDSTKWNNNPFNTGDFALLNGDENETFKVADAIESNQAVNLGQLKDGAKFSFPSNDFVVLTENTGVAPANGYIRASGVVSGSINGYVSISVTTKGISIINRISSSFGGGSCVAMIPVEKGDSYTIASYNASSVERKFIYAIGEI